MTQLDGLYSAADILRIDKARQRIAKLASDVAFDHDEHRYRSRSSGRVYPSVTAILAACGFYRFADRDETAAERGRVVHSICELLDEGDLNRASIDPELAGYVSAYEEAKTGLDLEFLAIEPALVDVTTRTAGKPDRIAVRRKTGRICIPDIKTGAGEVARYWRLQTAAYAAMLGRSIAPTIERIAIKVHADGRYRVRVATLNQNVEDLLTWTAIRTLFDWRERNKFNTTSEDE